MLDQVLREVGQKIISARSIVVVSHIRPDGDAIGSLLGLGLALREKGKKVQMVLQDGIPASFKYLDGSQLVQKAIKEEFDLICVVDCSDLERTGNVLPIDRKPDINLDHHATNLNFAEVNVVDSQAVATTELIYDLLESMGWSLSQAVASALLTGLITDTIGFRTSNITPKALRLAAFFLENGTDLSLLYRKALVNKSIEAARLWGLGLSKLECEEGMVWTVLTQADRQQVNYPGGDDADLINMLSAIDGYEIAMIFVEQKKGKIKVSWRSQPSCDVSKIALQFGGGGHPRASGAEIEGGLIDVKKKVLSETKNLIGTSVRNV